MLTFSDADSRLTITIF
uniref:Uncharacterized protein n=1 Tax=Anguilla anguilla TaxID=7936 RepID=A0A0E9XJ41_ANGAN